MDVRSLQAEVERVPFQLFRLNLASGKTVDVRRDGQAWMLRNAMMLLQAVRDKKWVELYDIISVRNVERIEQLPF